MLESTCPQNSTGYQNIHTIAASAWREGCATEDLAGDVKDGGVPASRVVMLPTAAWKAATDLQRSAGEPRSTILREHCSVLTPSALQRVDVSATTCFDTAQPTVDATAGLPVDIAATMCFCAPQPVDTTADLPEKSQKLVSDLSKLANKRNTDAAELWPVIVSSTDELLLAAETLRPVFEIGMRALLAEAGLTDEALIVGPLKDPVRIYEKALDDYSGRFGASILPVACVVDVLRTRLVCRSGSGYIVTQQTLEDGLVFDVGDGTTARLELIRSKNKYRLTDPTHFR